MKKIYLLIIIICSITALLIDNYRETELVYIEIGKDEKEIRKEISSHNSDYVITTKETNLYDKNYKKIGTVNKDIKLKLDNKDLKITSKTKYFKIDNLNYYISYKDVKPSTQYEINKRYKDYIVFNENIKTNKETILYKDNKYVFKLNKSMSLPIIIKDNNKLYVEYNNELYYVKKKEVKVIDSVNTDVETRDNIRTLTYHAAYKKGETCRNAAICQKVEMFDEQMKYLKDNNYLTLTLDEVEMFLDKKIRIPEKTIVITMDDGNLALNEIEILEKYQLYATYFIITGRYDIPRKSDYVEYASHTDSLHVNYKCAGGNQGGLLLCEDEDKVIKDLKLSQEKLGGSKHFAYPFFDYNERAIKLLKECGFTLAYVGQASTDGYATYTTNRYRMPRKTVFANYNMNQFINLLK